MSTNGFPSSGAGLRTGLAPAILREIVQLLGRLAETGETGSIDLRSLPMTNADRAELEERLGHGEVEARLGVAGVSEVWETSYAGAWWIRHLGAGDMVAAEEIAITRIPDILVTHPADVRAAAARMQADLNGEP